MKRTPTFAQSETSGSPDEGPQVALPMPPQLAAWRAVHRKLRQVGVVLVILLLSSAALFWFVLPSGSATVNATPTPRVLVQTVQARLYPFPSSQIGLMQPAVDAQGNLWVGEMGANRLARLDGLTGAIITWEPPDAKFGIMTTGNTSFIDRFTPSLAQIRWLTTGVSQKEEPFLMGQPGDEKARGNV